MSRQVVMQQMAGLDFLNNIFEALDDRKKFKEANEAFRKEFALTEEEQKKADAARDLIKKNDEDRAELEKQQGFMQKNYEAHEKNAQALSEDRKKFNAENDALAQRISEHKVIESQNNALKAENLAQKTALDKKAGELTDREKKVTDLEKSLSTRAEKVLNREKALEIREKNL